MCVCVKHNDTSVMGGPSTITPVTCSLPSALTKTRLIRSRSSQNRIRANPSQGSSPLGELNTGSLMRRFCCFSGPDSSISDAATAERSEINEQNPE